MDTLFCPTGIPAITSIHCRLYNAPRITFHSNCEICARLRFLVQISILLYLDDRAAIVSRSRHHLSSNVWMPANAIAVDPGIRICHLQKLQNTNVNFGIKPKKYAACKKFYLNDWLVFSQVP